MPEPSGSFPGRDWLLAPAVFALALAWFEAGRAAEPEFADEVAFTTQSYFYDLFIHNRRQHAYWLEYPAYDLPPLPKYLIGAALHAAGRPDPGHAKALAWYQNINANLISKQTLLVARLPSVAMGALGCVAIYALGTIAAGRRVGLLASFFLMANPLYRLHARRAMADVSVEALVLLALAAGLWAWSRAEANRWGTRGKLAGSTLAGVLVGLAVAAKLNGALAFFIIAAWALLSADRAYREFGPKRGVLAETPNEWRPRVLGLVGGLMLTGFVSLATFAALNPFLTASPRIAWPQGLFAAIGPSKNLVERLDVLARHRVKVPREQQSLFREYALIDPIDKIKAVAVQGFGRFGPLGPPRHDSRVPYPRFAWERDAGALLWGPIVLAGLIGSIERGRRQRLAGRPPTGWAVAVQAVVALVVVTAYIPLAWDRYFLSIQPGSALLGAMALVGLWDLVRGRFRRPAASGAV